MYIFIIIYLIQIVFKKLFFIKKFFKQVLLINYFSSYISISNENYFKTIIKNYQ